MDEFILRQITILGQPLLRFYSWSERGATFGYSQRHGDVRSLTDCVPLVRRPTGGGLVPHGEDWTYSLVIPPTAPWYALKAAQSYERAHTWMASALARLGLSSSLAPESQNQGPGQCFVGAEKFDLLWQGRKIAGAAQRRTRQGLLIQGSLQPAPQRLAKADWQKAVCDYAHEQWRVRWTSFELEPSMEEGIQELLREKYSKLEYNQRR